MQVTRVARSKARNRGPVPGTPVWHTFRPSRGASLKLIEALAVLTLLISAALAQSPPLVAQDAWVRATPGADIAAAYVTLRNASPNAVTVTGVQSPVAGHAMIHETTVQG